MRWRMRFVPQLVLLLSTTVLLLTVVVRSEEQPNPDNDGESATNANGLAGDANEGGVQNFLSTGLRLEHELVKEQADAPSTVNGSSEGGIVAIHVDAVGGKEQLRPTLRGLSYLATRFLPQEYKFIEVLSATREVVAGVRYELIVSADDEIGDQKHICRLVILEKPWITTEYGEKYRTLEYSNCTSPSAANDGNKGTPSSVEEPVSQLNPIFDANLRQNEALTPQQMDEIEQQIIVEKVEVLEITSTMVPPSNEDLKSSAGTSNPITSTTDSEGLSEAAMSAIDQLFGFVSAPLQTQPVNRNGIQQENANRQEVTEETIVPIKVIPNRADTPETITPTIISTTPTPVASLDQQVQSTFEEVFKTHQEIQKALDEVIANGGGRDVQLKYRPVFDSLLQKVKASIDSYYRTTNDGDANVDTAAFVVRDNTHLNGGRGMMPTRTVLPTRTDDRSSQESDEDSQQRQALPAINLQPPKFDVPTATFGRGSDEDEDNEQVLTTNEQLAKELQDETEVLQRVKKQSDPREPQSTRRRSYEVAESTVVDLNDVTMNPQTESLVSTSTDGAVPAVAVNGPDTTSSSSSDEETNRKSNKFQKKFNTASVSSDESNDNVAKKLSKEELTRQLNADEGLHRNKRDFSGGFYGSHSSERFGGFHGGSFGGGSHSGGGYYGGGYYGGYFPLPYYGYYNPYQQGYYHGHHRGKRNAPSEDIPTHVDGKDLDDIKVATDKDRTNLQPPLIERVTMAFGQPDEDDADAVEPMTLTKTQLTEQLNVDEGHARDKRGFSSSFDHSSSENHNRGHYGWHYPRPTYYDRAPPYYYNYNRGKRSSPAAESNAVNLDDATQEASMKVIANEAIARLDHMDSDPYKRMLLEVLDARRVSQRSDQSRSTYVLRVLTANSHCAEEESNVPESCRGLLMPGTTKECTFEVHVSKAKADDPQQVELTKSKCQKQPIQLGGRFVGGATPVDLSDPEHVERIRLGLVGYENGKHSNFEIQYGTVQVVAGTIHRYKIALKDDDEQVYSTCNVKVFTPLPSAPNADKPEYEFDCQDDKEDDAAHRRRRDVVVAPPKKLNKVPKVGGIHELTQEEYAKDEHQGRVREGLRKQSALVDGSGNERKVKIVGATMQLVAGKSYTYRLTFPDDESKRVCNLTIWEKPWLKEKAPEEAFKASFVCPDTVNRAKRAADSFCVGCASALSTQEYGTTEHQERINKILGFHGVQRSSSWKVINATSQVVAGMKYVYFLQQDDDVCKLTSWERVWLEKSHPKDAYIYSYECDKVKAADAKTRTRRSVPGGSRSLTKEELTDDEHMQRVDRILVSDGGSKASSNARIVSGTVQVVAGKLYKYAVEFDINGDSKLCKLSSWERPWLEEKEPTQAYKYTVSCPDENGSQGKRRQRRHAKKAGASNELTADELKDRSHVERIKAGMVSYNSERSKAYDDFEILAGSTQQVAGSLYKYTFRVTSVPDIVCKISIWERVWLDSQDQRKYNVKCTGDDDTEQQPEAKPEAPVSSSTTTVSMRRRSVRSLKIDDDEHVRRQFDKFRHHHRRQYGSSMEHEMRFNIFRNNLFKIDQLNKFERGTAKYGVTRFADMTLAEYRSHTGLVVPKHDRTNHIRNRIATESDVENVGDIPRSFDWRDQGAVTEVKNQGSCGSCWAFSAIGNIEGLHQIKTNQLESYSEQELLDCDTVDNACGGGYMDDAFKAIEKLGGLELENDYPYKAKKQKSCQFNATLSHVRVNGAVDMPKNETFIAQYLIKNGPIAVGLNANAMQFYRGGISHPWHPLCNHKSIDHGVLIVGYGVKEYPMFNKTLPYWIIKNSWGPSWGEQGYYRIYRGDNSCGVSEMASSAVLA